MALSIDRAAKSRHLACARCGTVFECAQAGECWCAAEPFRLPMPDAAGEDCLCPACLSKAAALSLPPRSDGEA